jgi:hypothetical protein
MLDINRLVAADAALAGSPIPSAPRDAAWCQDRERAAERSSAQRQVCPHLAHLEGGARAQ